jgi:hypothetical protein
VAPYAGRLVTTLLQQHVTRLMVLCASFIAGVLVYAALIYLIPRPSVIPVAQASHLLWALVLVAVLNLVTLTPISRAMLAGPLRVYAVSQDQQPLLRAHLVAQVVLFARLEATALFGLVLWFLTGRADWFWAFAAIALAGMVVLWPSSDRVKAALGLS